MCGCMDAKEARTTLEWEINGCWLLACYGGGGAACRGDGSKRQILGFRIPYILYEPEKPADTWSREHGRNQWATSSESLLLEPSVKQQ